MTVKSERSERMGATIEFKCPVCKSVFEFDLVDENELVSCPLCRNDFRTVKKGEILKLEDLTFETYLASI